MGKRKYEVTLSSEEIDLLIKIIHTGKSSAREILHANILIAVNTQKETGLSHAKIATIFQTSAVTVQKVIATYVNEGISKAIQRKKRITPPVPAKVDGACYCTVL